MHNDDALAQIEAGMVAIRRRQTRRTLAQETGETSAVFDVVDAVEAAEAGVTVSDVARALGIAQPQASKLVAAAVEQGLIRREADQGDGRRAFLVRTEAGRALSDRVHAARRQRFAQATREWSEADRTSFANLLTKFVEGLQ